jgi:hypothetical protein
VHIKEEESQHLRCFPQMPRFDEYDEFRQLKTEPLKIDIEK